MKNIFLLFVMILSCSNLFAQEKVYVSEKYGNALKLILKADGTYQLIYNEGTYEQKSDSIYLHSVAVSKGDFTVIPVNEIVHVDSLMLSFSNDAGYLSTYNIAIAASSGDDNNLAFYPLYYYQPNTTESYNDNIFNVTIKKEKYLYLAKKNYVTNETEVYKFEIPQKVNALNITDNSGISSNLVAAFNEKGNLVVSENGTYPVEFVLQEKLKITEKPKSLNYTPVKNLNIDWNFTSIYNDNYTTPYADTVKITIEPSLKDALNNLKTNPKSCLIIVNDNEDVFDQFITIHKTVYNDLKYYDETDKNIYDFIFYNLKDIDKTWLTRKGYSPDTKFIALGLNENPIFSSEESVKKLSTDGYYSYPYLNLARQIKSTANIVSINEKLLDKKASVEQLKSVLYNAGVTLNHRYLFPDAAEYTSNDESGLDSGNSTEYSDYYNATLKGQFYKSKITKQELDNVWDKVLNYYEKKSDYDKQLFHIIYKELNNDGLSMNLFGENRCVMNKTDFKAFDYLLKHYQKATSENNNTDSNYDYYSYFPSLTDVKYLISGVLSRNLSDCSDVIITAEHKKEILTRYGTYIYNSPNDSYILNNYVYSLISEKNEKELFSFYEQFISKFDTKNIIESLNNFYENNYDLNWYELKNNFSTMANNVSWYVVENKISDPGKIKKAIEWSEMSLKLSRNNAYYIDTLAQLYYKSGEKQKAISLQEEAIKNFKDNDSDPETLSEMKNVLNKMKSGNY